MGRSGLCNNDARVKSEERASRVVVGSVSKSEHELLAAKRANEKKKSVVGTNGQYANAGYAVCADEVQEVR
jgi:hypothetical protein